MGSFQPFQKRSIPRGVYCPTQCFFDPATEELDSHSITKHAIRLAQSGITGIVTNGSNGESVYLSPSERKSIIITTRTALDSAGYTSIPIISGASAQSTRETISLCKDAADACADAVLIMVPSFFKWAMTPSAIESYFIAIADNSPLPVIIYNYPAAVAGIDLDSDMLIKLSHHPNINGTKFTCGNVGKLARVAAVAGEDYLCFSGVADQILPSLTVGASGAIVGAANVFPRACVEVFALHEKGDYKNARKLQTMVAAADWAMTKRAIPGFKTILQQFHGYGGRPRAPMMELTEDEKDSLVKEITEIMALEDSLNDTKPVI